MGNGYFCCAHHKPPFHGSYCTSKFESFENLFAHAMDKPGGRHPWVALALLRERPSVADKKGGLKVCVDLLRRRGVEVPPELDPNGCNATLEVQQGVVARWLEEWTKNVLKPAVDGRRPVACPVTKDRFPLARCECKAGLEFETVEALYEHAADMMNVGMHHVLAKAVADVQPGVVEARRLRQAQEIPRQRYGHGVQGQRQGQGRGQQDSHRQEMLYKRHVLATQKQLEAKQRQLEAEQEEVRRQTAELNARLAQIRELEEQLEARKAEGADATEIKKLEDDMQDLRKVYMQGISKQSYWQRQESAIVEKLKEAALALETKANHGRDARRRGKARDAFGVLPLLRVSGKVVTSVVKGALEARNERVAHRLRTSADDIDMLAISIDGYLDKLFETGLFKSEDEDTDDGTPAVGLDGVEWRSFQKKTEKKSVIQGKEFVRLVPDRWRPYEMIVDPETNEAERTRRPDDPFLSYLARTLGEDFADCVYAWFLDAEDNSKGAGTANVLLWEPAIDLPSSAASDECNACSKKCEECEECSACDCGACAARREYTRLKVEWRALALKHGGLVPNTREVLARGREVNLGDFRVDNLLGLVAALVDHIAGIR